MKICDPNILGILDAVSRGADSLSSDDSSPEDLLSLPVTASQHQYFCVETTFFLCCAVIYARRYLSITKDNKSPTFSSRHHREGGIFCSSASPMHCVSLNDHASCHHLPCEESHSSSPLHDYSKVGSRKASAQSLGRPIDMQHLIAKSRFV